MKLRYLTGGIIALHGLLRTIFIDKYIAFIHENFLDIFPNESGLTVVASLFPFLEFFVGLLIFLNLGKKGTLWIGFLISLIMGTFLFIGNLYPRLIYHVIVVILLICLYFQPSTSNQRKVIL